MSEGRGLLPKWRYWPGVVIALLVVVAMIGPFVARTNPNDQTEPARVANATNQNSRSDDAWWHYSGAWIAIFTIVLTGSTIGLWVSNERVLYHARKSSERQLRAYVYVSETTGKEAANSLELSIDIKNFGQTPAYDVAVYIHSGEAEWPDNDMPPHTIEELVQSATDFRPTFNLAPGHVTTNSFEARDPRLSEAISRAKIGKYAIFLYGLLTYRDAFGFTRNTRFRYVYNNVAMRNGGKLPYARNGNIAD